MNITDIFISLLRAEIAESGVENIPVNEIDSKTIMELLHLAETHDVSGTVFASLVECGALSTGDEAFARFVEAEDLSYFRLKRLEHSFFDITSTFEEAGIDYVPLKGSVLRKYYPSPLMRMSADIDILVKERDLDSAVRVLSGKPGYRVTSKKSFHDISLYTPDGMHLELHFNVKENTPNLDAVLERVWDYTVPVSQKKHEFALKPEFFVFHLISHMVYHFTNGGCGVRPFSDIWVYSKKVGYDEDGVLSLCRECGIEDFYKNAKELASVWFDGKTHSPLTRHMEAHVIHNAICGDVQKGVATRQARKGGRAAYVLTRIFVPYRVLKIRYRTLERWPILLPFFEVVRWFSFLFGDKKRASEELRMTKKLTSDRMKKIKKFFSDVGLPQEKN